MYSTSTLRSSGRRRPALSPRIKGAHLEGVLALEPRKILTSFKRQSLAFVAFLFYVFIEYVRPQSVWPVIDVLPWGLAALLAAMGFTIFNEPAKRRPWLLIDSLFVVFNLVLLGSVATAYLPGEADLEIWFNWVLLYYLATRLATTPERFLLFLFGFLLWSLKMSQHGARTFIMRGGAFASWGATGGPGWFHNSGEFAIQMCIFLPLSLYWALAMRPHWSRWKSRLVLTILPGTAFLSLVASSSRGGQLGAAAVLLYMLVRSRHRVRGLLALVVLLPALWAIMPEAQKARFETMGEDDTSQTRLTYWEDGIDIMNEHPLLGIGYDNWLPYYRSRYNPVGELPHNVFVEAGAEMGYFGVGAFISLILATFYTNYRTRKLAARDVSAWGDAARGLALGLDAALVGFLASGFFVTVLFYPFFWMNLSMTSALHLSVRSSPSSYVPVRGQRTRRRRHGDLDVRVQGMAG